MVGAFPGGEHQLRVAAERSTDGGQTTGFVTGGRGALYTASWTNQSNATLTNAPTVRQGASPDAGGGSVDRPLPPRCLAERNQQTPALDMMTPSYTYANRA